MISERLNVVIADVIVALEQLKDDIIKTIEHAQ